MCGGGVPGPPEGRGHERARAGARAGGPDPRRPDRGGCGAARPVRAAPAHLRRLRRLRPGARPGRGRGPGPRAARLRQHAQRELGHRPADHPAARAGPRPDPPGRRRRAGRPGRLLRLRLHRGDRQAGPAGRPRRPARAGAGAAPSGGPRRPVRAPLGGAAVARVGGRRGRRRRGPGRRRRPRRPAGPAGRGRGPAGPARLLLRGVERHRHPVRHRAGHRAAAPARRPRGLGLHGRRAVRPDPDAGGRRRQGRRRVLAAQVRRRTADPGRAGGAPAAGPAAGADRAGRRDGLLRRPGRDALPGRPGRPGGGRHPGDRGVRPGRPGRRAQGGGRHRDDRRARAALVAAGAGPVGGQPAAGDPRQPGRTPAADRVGPGAPRRAGAAPRLRRRAAQRPLRRPGRAAGAPAPARTGTGCCASPRAGRRPCGPRSSAATRGSSPAGPG